MKKKKIKAIVKKRKLAKLKRALKIVRKRKSVNPEFDYLRIGDLLGF